MSPARGTQTSGRESNKPHRTVRPHCVPETGRSYVDSRVSIPPQSLMNLACIPPALWNLSFHSGKRGRVEANQCAHLIYIISAH